MAVNFGLGGYQTIFSDLNDEILAQSIKKIKTTQRLFLEEDLITSRQATKMCDREYIHR